MIYLDNSATTYPKPQSVRRRMAEALERFGANPGRGGFRMSMETAQAVYAVRRKAAALFGAPGPECVSFQPSCTQALNIVIHSLQPGDHVLVTDLEHNAVLRPLKAMEAHGVSFTVVPVTPCDNDATLDAFRRAIRENTRMFICTQASNVWGIRVPVERLAALAHVYGAEICVDAAQSGGVVPIRAAEDNIDYLCCAGHKGLYGPMGTGLLITGRGEKLKSLIQGGTGTLALQLEQPRDMPEYLESGTQNVPGILALGAGIDFVRAPGGGQPAAGRDAPCPAHPRRFQPHAARKAVYAAARHAVFRAGARLQCARHGERGGGRLSRKARDRRALRLPLRAVCPQENGDRQRCMRRGGPRFALRVYGRPAGGRADPRGFGAAEGAGRARTKMNEM